MSAAIQLQRSRGNVRAIDSFDSAATQAITAAITAANYKETGVTYEPFVIKVVPGEDAVRNLWNSERGDTAITFVQSTGAQGPFLPLGDTAMPGFSSGGTPAGVMLFAPSAAHPDALAHPTGFQWILDDAGSGNSRDIDYFRMNAPAGYSAVGICFNDSGNSPDPNNYWCVKNEYVQAITRRSVWSDDGQHWKHHNGNLNAPAFGAAPPTLFPDQMMLLPPTFLSDEDAGSEGSFGLLAQIASLPVQAFAAPEPTFDPNVTTGDTTSCGLTSVKIVPYTAMGGDEGYPNQAIASPFYYVAAEPYWMCQEVLPTPLGGSFTVEETIGTSQSDSKTFSESTSISVSAEFGAEFDVVSSSVSTTFTKEWSLTTEHTTGSSTEATNSVTINFPHQPLTSVWQRQTQIAVFRNDLTHLVPTTYGNSDLRFAPSGTPTILQVKRIR